LRKLSQLFFSSWELYDGTSYSLSYHIIFRHVLSRRTCYIMKHQSPCLTPSPANNTHKQPIVSLLLPK
jgi:hypothetical protein